MSMDYKAMRVHRKHHRTGGETKHHDEAEDKKLIKKEMSKAKIKLKSGGSAHGKKSVARMDKPVRPGRQGLKTGGKSKHKEPHTKVNVIVAGGGQQQPPIGMPPHPPMAPPAGAMPPRPPMAPPGAGGPPGMPPGGMPPGAGGPPPGMPMKPPGMMNRGGSVNTKIKAPKMEFGAGGGKGRLEKGPKYGAKALARGGTCESEE